MSNFPYKLTDLTHTLWEHTPTWDGGCGFNHDCVHDYNPDQEYQFRVHKISMNEGIGTHIDSSAHCIKGGKTIDQLDLNDLIAPCVVIDISNKVHPKYSCSVEDIQTFENEYGEIQKNAIVLIFTGWSKLWDDKDQYRNNLQFPSCSIEAADYLLQKDIAGVGIDTLSPDREEDGFPVHKAVLGKGKVILENIANLEDFPRIGSHILIAPTKIGDGTEAPIRLIGLTPI